MSERIKIGLSELARRALGNELCALLEEHFDVEFSAHPSADELGGVILSAAEAAREVDSRPPTGDQLILVLCGDQAVGAGEPVDVRFAAGGEVPFPFGGRQVQGNVWFGGEALSLEEGEVGLLSCERGALWTRRVGRGRTIDRCVLRVPPMPPGGSMHDVLNGRIFLGMVPLMEFLRRLTGYDTWRRPVPRAQFMFDDPNLHWPTYGFVDYADLARRATREQYHVSFATIPLDAWFAHRPTVQVFHDHSDRLSLCVHGNNHLHQELRQAYGDEERSALLSQAIKRVSRLEARTGLTVSRVMVPPHGACSHDMFAAMPAHGFEAACVSSASLRSHNQGRDWLRGLGYQPVERAAGCPVLPRWGLDTATTNTLLLAAYLDRALVCRAHHQDLRGGPEVLDELARFINSLGAIHWSNTADLSRRAFYSKEVGSVCTVRPCADRIQFDVPVNCHQLILEPTGRREPESWRVQDPSGAAGTPSVTPRTAIPVVPGQRLLIERLLTPPPHPGSRTALPAKALIRRWLTEARDRVQACARPRVARKPPSAASRLPASHRA